jgi:hypothetical protein
MKKAVVMLMFAATVAGSIDAQTENPKRSVLHTLKQNEIFTYNYYGEGAYYLDILLHEKDQYACVVTDTVKGKDFLIVNGKTTLTENNIELGWSNFEALLKHGYTGAPYNEDQSKQTLYINGKKYGDFANLNFIYKGIDRYAFYYTEEGTENWYVNINGKQEGPFDYAKVYYNDSLKVFEYDYMLAGRMFENINGKTGKSTKSYVFQNNGKEYLNICGWLSRGYDNIDEYNNYKVFDNKHYSFRFEDNKKRGININGNEELFDGIYQCYFSENGNYAYKFEKNSKYGVNINGKKSDWYEYVSGFYYNEKNKNYHYYFKDEGKYGICINGKIEYIESYIHCWRTSDNGKIAYCYYDKSHNWIVNFDGKKYNNIISWILTSTGEFFYRFKQNGKEYFNSNGINSEKGYDEITDIKSYANKYLYTFTDEGRKYINVNGNISEKQYDRVVEFRVFDSGKYAYIYEKEGNTIINIGGSDLQMYNGLSEEGGIWRGDDIIRPFYFFDNGKYAYRVKGKDKQRVNINGIEQIYDEVSDFKYFDDGNYFYKFNNNNKAGVSINGNESKLYDNIFNINYDEDGTCSYYFEDGGKQYIYKNGNVTSEKIDEHNPKIALRDGWPVESNIIFTENNVEFYSNHEYDYVVIGYKRFGNAPAQRAWFNYDKNAFIWIAIESKELVVYEYKLN